MTTAIRSRFSEVHDTPAIVDHPPSVRERLAPGLLLLVYLLGAWPTRATMVDDAYVSARYARLWAEGCGLRYNCGEPPVEGFTNFLWVVLLAPGTALPIPLADWATGLGLTFGAATVLGVWRVARAGGAAPSGSFAAAALVGALPAFGVASTNGLETALFTATLVWTVEATLRDRRSTPVLAAALYLVRPEGILVGALLVAARRRLRPLGVWAGLVGVYFLGRWAWFGTLGPNTWAAQARDEFSAMWEMNADYLWAGLPTFAGFGALAVVASTSRLRGLVLLGAVLAGVALQVFNWMPGLRLFLPSLVLVAAAAGPALSRWPWARALAGAWLAWLQLDHRAEQVRYDGQHSVLPGNGGEALGRRIAATAPPGTWLLVRDAGVTAYYAGPGVKVIDMHPFSLTDPVLTGRPWSADHLLDRDVGFVVTTGRSAEETSQYAVETRLLADPRLAGFVRAGVWRQHHRRWYTLFVRPDLATGG